MTFDLFDNYKKIDEKYKVVFLSTIIFGVLSQGMGIFNKYSFHDDIGAGFSTLGATITSGRWMLEVFSKMELFIFGDGHYSMPVINGFVSILCIAFAACLLVSLFDIKNKTLCAIIGGIMVVFPTITGMFGFMFTVPSYMLSMLMGIGGSYLVCKNTSWKYILLGILLMSCSVGVYQAFIPVILSTFVIYLIKCCIDCKETKQLFNKMAIILISVILFMIVYFVVNKIALSLIEAKLTTYQGIDTMGKASISDYLYRLIYAYGKFFILKEGSTSFVFYSNIKYVYYMIMIMALTMMLLLFSRVNKINKINSIILLGLFGLIPLASNFIFVMVEPSNVHALMVYGQVMPFILVAMLLDRIDVKEKTMRYLSTVCTISLLLINIMFCRFDNQCYLKAEFLQQETISYFTTLITRIKSADNYDDKLPVSFVFIDGGHIKDESLNEIKNLDYIKLYPYDAGLYEYVNNYEWKNFMKRWCGYAPVVVDGEDLKTNEEVLEMSCYPDAGSIKVVDNRVVVRFQ